MKVNESEFLSRIPEYLIDEKTNQDSSKELIENINPNTINLTASLAEKVLYGLDKFNTWTDFNAYSKEFKLDELFADLGDNFALKQVELLKGFFKFKGTTTDLKYILNSSGYDIELYDASYFENNSFTDILNREKYEDTFTDFLLNSGKTEADFVQLLEKSYIKYVNNVDPILIGEYAQIVVNQADIISGELLFASLGWEPSSNQLSLIDEAIQSWIESRNLRVQDYDCRVNTDIRVDMDSDRFTGVSIANLVQLIRSILETRLSVCTLLKGITVMLTMRDTYNVDVSELFENDFEFIWTEDIPRTEEIVRTSINYRDIVEEYTWRGVVVENSNQLVDGSIMVPGVSRRVIELFQSHQFDLSSVETYQYKTILETTSLSSQRSFKDEVDRTLESFRMLISRTDLDMVYVRRVERVDNFDPYMVNKDNPLMVPGKSFIVEDDAGYILLEVSNVENIDRPDEDTLISIQSKMTDIQLIDDLSDYPEQLEVSTMIEAQTANIQYVDNVATVIVNNINPTTVQGIARVTQDLEFSVERKLKGSNNWTIVN